MSSKQSKYYLKCIRSTKITRRNPRWKYYYRLRDRINFLSGYLMWILIVILPLKVNNLNHVFLCAENSCKNGRNKQLLNLFVIIGNLRHFRKCSVDIYFNEKENSIFTIFFEKIPLNLKFRTDIYFVLHQSY